MQVVTVEKLLPELSVEVTVTYNALQVSKHDTLAHCFRDVMANIIDHLRCNIGEASAGEVEGIHQLRVGIRRARAALRMFEPLLPANKVKRFDKRLRNYGLTFGVARDWDVFLRETFDEAWPEAEIIRARALAQQEKHHDQVNAVLRQPHFEKLLDRMGEWSHDLRFPDEKISKVAPHLLDRMFRQVRRRERKANQTDVKSLHRLRRSVKRLRYAVEFVGAMYPKKRVRRYSKLLKRSQDRLGKVNDAAVTEDLLRKINMLNPIRSILAERQTAARNQMGDLSGLKSERFW
jgi:CHAD domain-containing protein